MQTVLAVCTLVVSFLTSLVVINISLNANKIFGEQTKQTNRMLVREVYLKFQEAFKVFVDSDQKFDGHEVPKLLAEVLSLSKLYHFNDVVAIVKEILDLYNEAQKLNLTNADVMYDRDKVTKVSDIRDRIWEIYANLEPFEKYT